MTQVPFTALLVLCVFFARAPLAQTPSISEAPDQYCVPIEVSPTRDAISFVRRYKVNADREGIKRTDIGEIDADQYYLVTTKKSPQKIHELAAEQLSMGLISHVYRLEEKFVGSKTLYVFDPAITSAIYGDGKKHYLHKQFQICLGRLDESKGTVILSESFSEKTELYLKVKVPNIKFKRDVIKTGDDALLKALPPGVIE